MAIDTAVTVIPPSSAALAEQVVIKGDLSKLTEQQRMDYYTAVCRSLGLNPMTRPFEYIALNGKLTLYATRSAADQLRSLRGITITSLEPSQVGDLLVVVATGRDRAGREDSSTGAVAVKGLSGEALANAMMKAETKAKRRLTLSLAGLGWSDETEVESIGQRVNVDTETGEIKPPATLADRVAARRAAISEGSAAVSATATGGADEGDEPSSPAAEPQPATAPSATACGDEDASPMAMGLCGLAPKHSGVHRSKSGTWPR